MLRTVTKLSSKLICQTPLEVIKERGEYDDPATDHDESTHDQSHHTPVGVVSKSLQVGSFCFEPEWSQCENTPSPADASCLPQRQKRSKRHQRVASNFQKLLCYKEEEENRRENEREDQNDRFFKASQQPQQRVLTPATSREDVELWLDQQQPQSPAEFYYQQQQFGKRIQALRLMAMDDDNNDDQQQEQEEAASFASSSSSSLESTSCVVMIPASDQTLDAMAKLSSPYIYQAPEDEPEPQQPYAYQPQQQVVAPPPASSQRLEDMHVVLRRRQQSYASHSYYNNTSSSAAAASFFTGQQCDNDDCWMMDDVSSISSGSVSSRF